MKEKNRNDNNSEKLESNERKKEINNLSKKEKNYMQAINNLEMERTLKKMKSSILSTELYSQSMKESINSLQNTLKKLAELIRPITETVINFQIKMTPYFKELAEALQTAKDNPDSLMNWINYCEKLEEYLWAFPFDIKSEELKNILEKVNSEEEFDKYMIKYFDDSKIAELKDNIVLMLPYKHKVTFKQIMESFFNKNYALCNLGITAIIDDLCTFFLKDKGCLKRNNLFLPIIEDVDKKTNDNFKAIPLIILNANINKIYENVNFNKRISISTHKKTRRSTNQHGKKFVNNKLDTIMLLNTIYYLLLITKNFSQYKGRVIYVDSKRKMEMVDTFNRTEISRFYLKKKYYRPKK